MLASYLESKGEFQEKTKTFLKYNLQYLLKTEFSAPPHLVYLELGVIPARYAVKKRKKMYLKKY